MIEAEAAAQVEVEARVRAAALEVWPRAQAHWSRFLLLGEPECRAELPSVAQIHLGTRQVTLDAAQIARYGLEGSLEAILAHEVGHHVRYPGTLAVHARLHLMEKALMPLEGYSVINLFTDLLINARLGVVLKEQLAAVYRAFSRQMSWRRDPAFLFYLGIYEELWALEPGELVGPGGDEFTALHPTWRAEAQLVAQNLLPLGPNIYTQFLYFLSVMVHWVKPLEGDAPESGDGFACRGDEPSPEEWADALVPDGREREAIRRAVREGWLSAEDKERLDGEDALERRIMGLPGQGTDDAELVPEVMAAWYRREAERYLVRPPPLPSFGEAVVPTTMEVWEPGDAVAGIDWPQTLRERGPVLGSAQPLQRTRIAEIEGWEVPFWQPRVEIYLDVSGSMPDPRTTYNAMTLAAQILTLGSVRAGGWVRALLYSHEFVRYWTWCRSAVEISRFLMHYVGGGTEYPFTVLASSIAECGDRQPVRAIISDHDFVSNWSASEERQRVFAAAARQGAPLVLLLHAVGAEVARPFARAGARVVHVEKMDDFPRMAAALARALFDDAGHPDGRRRG